MSATIKYKGTTLASITTNTSKTLKTSGKYCEGDIIVENVQDGGITPTGNKAITATTSTQTGIDVTNYATVSVAPTPSETKSVTTNGDVTPTSGKLLSKVTVNVPTGTARTSSDLTASGATVTVPAGLYASDASKSVASGTAGTPSASKSDVVSNTITVTPSVTNTTGYITGGTKTGTSVSVSASEVTSGNKSITATTSTQTDVDVTNYKTVSVAPTPSETKSTTVNGDVTPSSGKLLSKVTVNVPTGTARSASDLTVSGATVTVPAGLYSAQATKSVASGSAGTPSATKGTVSNNSVTVTPSVTNTTGYITGGTKTGTGVTVSASELVRGNKALTPSTTAQTNIDVKNYATASVAAITKELLASLDTDFVAENIKKDVDLFGLIGALEGGGGGGMKVEVFSITPADAIPAGEYEIGETTITNPHFCVCFDGTQPASKNTDTQSYTGLMTYVGCDATLWGAIGSAYDRSNFGLVYFKNASAYQYKRYNYGNAIGFNLGYGRNDFHVTNGKLYSDSGAQSLSAWSFEAGHTYYILLIGE